MKFLSKLTLLSALGALAVSCGSGGNNKPSIDLMPIKAGNKFEYINKEGQIVINPQFSNAGAFSDGLALVASDGEGKIGYIDEKGTLIINHQYKSGTSFREGFAWVVQENGAPTAINTKGEIAFSLQDAKFARVFSEGLAAYCVQSNGKVNWGFVDQTGQTKINPQFSGVGNFSGDMCAVADTTGKWGFIDKTGLIKINYQFGDASDFKGGVAAVANDGKWGLIDASGKFKINPQYDYLYPDGDLYLIQQSGKWGWVNADGKMVINPQFDGAQPFNGSDKAAIKSNNQWGYIDSEGKITINPQFEYALPYNGDAAIVKSGGRVGLIDAEGKYLLNPQEGALSEDFELLLITGETAFGYVETDYFNLSAITGLINVTQLGGINLNMDLNTIFKKFNFTPVSFSEHTVQSVEVNKDVKTDLYVTGDVFDYDPSVLATVLPSKITLSVSLTSAKSASKVEEVKKSIMDQMAKLQPLANENGSVAAATDGKLYYYLWQGLSTLSVSVQKEMETSAYDEYNIGD
ncbi:MAG: hypothetical protein RL092_881 [Bacteroidota bacterium]|jgi:hypothetical protein